MKKSILLLLTLFILAFQANAQEQIYNKQYAFNGSSLLSGLIDLPTSPYQIAIKTYGEKVNKRLQLGLTLNTNANVTNSNFTGNLGFLLRAGRERFEDFGKKNQWRLLYGLDGVYSLALNGVEDNFRAQISGGGAPFVGLQFRINERLSIYTEASYQALLRISPINGEVNIGITGSFSPPAAIWLAVDFYKEKKEKSGTEL